MDCFIKLCWARLHRRLLHWFAGTRLLRGVLPHDSILIVGSPREGSSTSRIASPVRWGSSTSWMASSGRHHLGAQFCHHPTFLPWALTYVGQQQQALGIFLVSRVSVCMRLALMFPCTVWPGTSWCSPSRPRRRAAQVDSMSAWRLGLCQGMLGGMSVRRSAIYNLYTYRASSASVHLCTAS